jgi:hypothetical protein
MVNSQQHLNERQKIALEKLILQQPSVKEDSIIYLDSGQLETILNDESLKGGSRRRRRSIPKSSRKFKKSSKRVFRKKSRSTRRR